jgi:WD40 repeat protein
MLQHVGSIIRAIRTPSASEKRGRNELSHNGSYAGGSEKSGRNELSWHKLFALIVSHGGQGADPTFVAFSPDGKHVVATGHRDDPEKQLTSLVAIFDAASGLVVSEFPQKGFRQSALAFGGRFVVIGYDNAFVGIEVATGQTRWRTPTTSGPGTFVRVAAMGFDSKPPWFEAALSDGNVIRINGLTGHEQRRFRALVLPPEPQRPGRPGKSDISSATFSGDGHTMAAASEEWVSLWDVQAGALRRKIAYARARGCLLAIAPDGKTLAIADVASATDFGEDRIRLYDVATGELVGTIEPVDDRANVLAFSPDGAKLLTGFWRGSAVVWDVHREPATLKLQK